MIDRRTKAARWRKPRESDGSIVQVKLNVNACNRVALWLLFNKGGIMQPQCAIGGSPAYEPRPSKGVIC